MMPLLSHVESEEDLFIQTAALDKFHQLLPQKVNVEFENTNITLSMHSQKRSVVLLAMLMQKINYASAPQRRISSRR